MFAAAKLKYGTILANVDWLHGSAESFLTITNLFIGKPRISNSQPYDNCKAIRDVRHLMLTAMHGMAEAVLWMQLKV